MEMQGAVGGGGTTKVAPAAVGGGGRMTVAPAAVGAPRPLAGTIFRLCMKTAIVLGSCYVVFVVYIGMTYTKGWLEMLRLLPMLIVAVTVPLLGAVLIQRSR